MLWEQLVVSSPGPSTRSAIVAVATDELVVAGTGEGTVVAVAAATGEVLWSADLTVGASLEEYNSYAMYPTIAGDAVFVAASTGVISALAIETGELLWESRVGGLFGGFPVVVDDTVIAARSSADLYDDLVDYAGSDGNRSGGVVAVSASTGEVRWELPSSLSSTVVSGRDGTVVVGSFDNQFVGNGTVAMLDAATGEEIWTLDDVDVESPAATGADVVVVAAQQLIALNGDGIELWRTSPDWCSCTFQFPTVVNDTVVVVTNEASVYGLDVRSGRTCWTVALGDNYGIAHPDSDGFASVAVGGVAGWIDTATGHVASALPLQGRALSIAPTAHGSIVSSSDGYIRMVDDPTTPDPQEGEPPQHQCAQ